MLATLLTGGSPGDAPTERAAEYGEPPGYLRILTAPAIVGPCGTSPGHREPERRRPRLRCGRGLGDTRRDDPGRDLQRPRAPPLAPGIGPRRCSGRPRARCPRATAWRVGSRRLSERAVRRSARSSLPGRGADQARRPDRRHRDRRQRVGRRDLVGSRLQRRQPDHRLHRHFRPRRRAPPRWQATMSVTAAPGGTARSGRG